MHVPLLDLNAQLDEIRDEIKIAVDDVIESTRYIMGPKVSEFEREIADYCGVEHGIGVSSGTDALLVSLMALDVGPGDIVLTTDYSFFATAGVVARLRATPVFLDIDPATYNLDPAKLKEWLDQNKDKIDKVKAIIPVHLFGQCADMKPIIKTARKYDIQVIEDAAQAIGAQYPNNGQPLKAGSMGIMGCLSFFPSKNLGGIGDGGMVVTRDDEIADKLRKLRNHGAAPKYYHSMVGGNFRLDSIQAAVLNVKLQYLDEWHKKRQENADYYNSHLNKNKIKVPENVYRHDYHIYNQYVIKVANGYEELKKHLRKKQIGFGVYYPVPFHLQECFDYLGYQEGDFPASEEAATSTIALPVYPELTTEMQDYVIESLNEFFD
ncbi:MAG: DegT/DnrJ/EryC1/StrS family aminotransferase [Candidatus Marinimicrobia bacterium]|nr:DegT/DnrJ/EryC1/StrS family aminotransferase [Candidatus Neomarinimicrobiota bacterium]